MSEWGFFGTADELLALGATAEDSLAAILLTCQMLLNALS